MADLSGPDAPGDGKAVPDELRQLRTLNDDLRVRNAALGRANSDLAGLVENLQQAHDLTEGIVETVRDPLLVLDPRMRVRKANAAFYDVFRASKEQTEGRLVYDLARGQWDLPKLRALLEEMLPENQSFENFEVEREFEGIGAKAMLLHARRLQVAEATEPMILLAIEDVTDRRVRERFAEAIARVAQTIDYEMVVTEAARLANRYLSDWCCVYVMEWDNSVRRAAVAHRDAAKQDLLAAVLRRCPLDAALPFGWPAADRARHAEVVQEVPDSALEAAAQDVEHLREMRGVGLKSSMFVPMVVRGGAIGAIAMASGLPRRFSASDLAMADELAKRAALAFDNARLYRRAQEAIREREQFISVAAHELRTPLATLRLEVEMLLSQAQSGTQRLADHSTSLNRMGRQTDRLTELINNLFDVAAITAGKIRLNVEDMDLAASVATVGKRFADELARRSVELAIRAESPVHGRWDRLRVEQVITNLLSNAIKYGSGKPIAIAVERVGATAVLKVQDQGIGIPPEASQRLFSAFERVAPSGYAGLGLGLYIVAQIVEAHGGTIRVTSEVGVGTTFRVELPGGA